MLPNTKLEIGEIVQLNPETTGPKAFAGCFAVVDAPTRFGAQLRIQCLDNELDETCSQMYYRAEWEEMEVTGGKAVWYIP